MTMISVPYIHYVYSGYLPNSAMCIQVKEKKVQRSFIFGVKSFLELLVVISWLVKAIHTPSVHFLKITHPLPAAEILHELQLIYSKKNSTCTYSIRTSTIHRV